MEECCPRIKCAGNQDVSKDVTQAMCMADSGGEKGLKVNAKDVDRGNPAASLTNCCGALMCSGNADAADDWTAKRCYNTSGATMTLRDNPSTIARGSSKDLEWPEEGDNPPLKNCCQFIQKHSEGGAHGSLTHLAITPALRMWLEQIA
jgi:hypothetical protein